MKKILLVIVGLSFHPFYGQNIKKLVFNEPDELFTQHLSKSESEKEKVRAVLFDYMEGTSLGQPERIRNAFHKELNLYSIKNNQLAVLSGQQYISYFKEGQRVERIGKIISIDIVNDAAMAKIEIDMPQKKRLYTDYMMLLRIEGKWKIVHKSYTYQPY